MRSVQVQCCFPQVRIDLFGITCAHWFVMRLNIPQLRNPLPVMTYDPPGHLEGEAVWIRMPVADPKSLGIVPGMEGDIEFDNGQMLHVLIGKRWSSHQAGGTLRIGVDSLGTAEPLSAE